MHNFLWEVNEDEVHFVSFNLQYENGRKRGTHRINLRESLLENKVTFELRPGINILYRWCGLMPEERPELIIRQRLFC